MDQWKRKLMMMLGSILLVLTLTLTGCGGMEGGDEGVGPGIEQDEGFEENEGLGGEEGLEEDD